MGSIVEKIGGITTVGEMIAALGKFPADLPIVVDCKDSARVYRVKPRRGETGYADRRGLVCIDSD